MNSKISVVAVVSLAGVIACNFEKTSNQLTARKVMVATLLATPPIEVDLLAIAAGDGGTPADAGFGSDAGVAVVPGQVAAWVFLGARTSESLDAPPEPVANADVSLQPAGGARVTLTHDGAGNYSKNSVGDDAFRYEEGRTYDFVARAGSEDFIGRVESVPQLERIRRFHDSPGYITMNANTELVFSRPDPISGQPRNLGFVTVFPIDDQGRKGEPTYSSFPSGPVEWLKVIALPAEWKTTQVTVPARAFPSARTTYAVLFQSMKTGGPESENLFTGSALVAGAADVGIVRTR